MSPEPELPPVTPPFDAHIAPELLVRIQHRYAVNHAGLHYRMILAGRPKINQPPSGMRLTRLNISEIAELRSFYTDPYPANWFEHRMLEAGIYTGVRGMSDDLVAVAGTHILSPTLRLAALGNIALLPAWRGHGLASRPASLAAHLPNASPQRRPQRRTMRWERCQAH